MRRVRFIKPLEPQKQTVEKGKISDIKLLHELNREKNETKEHEPVFIYMRNLRIYEEDVDEKTTTEEREATDLSPKMR